MLCAALVVGMTTGWPGGARPALAHEFALALVTPTSGTATGGLNGGDVADGFRLAVDQSPDVSHPPGADAGDHLGGIDVAVSVIDGATAADAAEAVKRQLAGLTAVVVIAADATASAVTAVLERSSVLLITAQGAGASAPADAGALHLTQPSAPSFAPGLAPVVAAAFKAAYGRELSAAAALGYDAGRLLDAAVARADDGVEDLDSVVRAAVEANDVLVSSAVSAPEPVPAAEQPSGASPDAPAGSGTRFSSLVVALAGGTLVALVAGLIGWRARSRRQAANETSA